MGGAATALDDNAALLAELCRFADALIERGIWMRQMAPAADAQGALASRRQLAHQQHAQQLDDMLASLWQQLERHMAACVARDSFIPWIHLARLFQLTPLEQQLILLALLPELDAGYRSVLLELADGDPAGHGGTPLSSVAHLLAADRAALQSAMLVDSPLRRWRMVKLEPSCDVLRLSGEFQLDPVLAAYLCGRAAPQLRLDEVLVELPAWGPLDSLPVDNTARLLAERFVARCGTAAPEGAGFLLQLQGPDERMLERICGSIFASLRMRCVRLDGAQWLARNAAEPRAATLERLLLLCRDALLCNRVLVLSDWRQLSGDTAGGDVRSWFESVLDTLLESQRYVVALNGPERLLTEHAHRYERHAVTPLLIRVPMPAADLRRRIWEEGASQHGLALSGAQLDQLANGYPFTHAQIESAWKELASRRLLDGGAVDIELLRDICRDACVSEQFTIAEEVKTSYRLEDIVLPPATLGWLEEVLQYAQHRHLVVEQWGFARNQSNSRNLCVLFYGPSGTGKTMAASIIANELNLGLYRVDLANVLSKYIGETEKHLAQLFDQAEAMNVVLYFDEAESLFAKRTETRDAHDRYANLQTGYLLQRIETYPGIVILSTNLLSNMDKAFTRRFKFMIEYPFPATAQRQKLWRKAFPADVPLADDLDLELLAEKAALSGGHINNIALRAAMYAATENQRVTMSHVLRAVEREYDKLGKVFSPSEFAWTEDD